MSLKTIFTRRGTRRSLAARAGRGADYNSIVSGSIWKSLVLYAIPICLSTLFQQFYATVDLVIIGQYAGSDALASVGATGSITNLMIGFFMGLSTGAGVVIAQHYGAGDIPGMRKSVHTSVAMALAGGLLLTLAGVGLARPLLNLMGTPDNVLDGAVLYMRIIFLGSLGNILYNIGAGILRAVGDSRRPFIYLVIGTFANIVLDLVFVALFKWGIAGVGIATIVSQLITAVLAGYNLLTTGEFHRVVLRDIRFHMDKLSQIIRIGIPAGLQSMVIALSNVVIQSNINTFGSAAIAGTSAAWRIDGFEMVPLQSFGLAMTTFSGQNLGAGQPQRVRRATLIGCAISGLSTMAIGALVLLFGRYIMMLFTSDEAVMEYGLMMVTIVSLSYWIFAISEILSGVMRGAGYTMYPMIASVAGMCGVRVIWMYTALPLDRTMFMLYMCYPVSWVCVCLLMLGGYLSGRWYKKYRGARVQEEPEKDV